MKQSLRDEFEDRNPPIYENQIDHHQTNSVFPRQLVFLFIRNSKAKLHWYENSVYELINSLLLDV